VKVTATQFTKVKNSLDRVVDVLDCPSTPEVFVTNNPFFNAGTFGVKEPFIVLNSAILRMLDEDELYCVVAHEVGHVLSGHALYKTVLWMLMRMSSAVLPIAGMLVRPLILALGEWDRKSELTADRAALLALQSEAENYHVLMKMAGGEDLSQMNVNDFFQQAWEYENQKTLLDGLYKLLNTAGESHPFPVIRLQELHTWASSGSYQAILGGSYPRRGEEETAAQDVREGYAHYRNAAQQSSDPVLRTVKKAGETLGKATEGLRDALKDILKKE
jgi:Zn-dependent protease with chaperone function